MGTGKKGPMGAIAKAYYSIRIASMFDSNGSKTLFAEKLLS